MLQKQTITPTTLAVLEKCMKADFLFPFYLAGGTNLALRLGHRLSIDLDFFCDTPFDTQEISLQLNTLFVNIVFLRVRENTIHCVIDDVKVSFFAFSYPLIAPLEYNDSLRLCSLQDIACMKCSALTGRTEQKDYRDLAYIFNTFSLKTVLEYCAIKFPSMDKGVIIRCLSYVHEANPTQKIISLDKKTWKMIVKRIDTELKLYFDSIM